MTIFPNLTKGEKKLFFLTLILIFIWVAHSFVIRPIVTKWKELDDRVSMTGLKLEKSQKIISKREKIQGEYKTYASPIKMVGSEEEEMAKFLTEIESLAGSSSVRIIDIKPRPIKKVEFYKKYLVELEGEGNINQMSKFIYDMQNSPHLLKIDDFAMGTKGAGTNLLKCHILVSKILIP